MIAAGWTMTIVRQIEITNEKGLHARASAKFVEVVESHDSKVEVVKDDITTAGNSIMGLLMLAASKGTFIQVSVDGPDEAKVMESLEALVKARFGEEF